MRNETMLTATVTSLPRLAAGVLLLSFVLTGVGITLWTGRNLYDWPAAGSASYYAWERGTVMAGMVAALLGLALLQSQFRAAGGPPAARIGLALIFVATVAGLIWEASQIGRGRAADALIVAYVVLALVGQAAIGLGLIQTELLPAWVGWATIIWSLGSLVVLPLLNTGDFYYPFIHMMVPLLLAIALLMKQ